MQVKDTNRFRRSTGLLALVCLVLQLALAPNIALANGRINFALVFAGVIALTQGGRVGVTAGFLAGLIFDLLGTGPVGLMSLLLAVAAYLMGVEVRNRIAEDPSGSVVVYVISAIAVSLLYNLAMFLVGEASSIIDVLFLRSLPTAVLSIVAFLPFVYFLSRGGSGPRLTGSSAARAKHSSKYSLGDI
ncbi:MAG: rod shape-determining protein MreD [Olsenella sp.]|nr:rod shape-determining protein MreD [Olsenella sp.]